MIQAQINASTLEQFYAQIVEQQLAAHGEEYCNQHIAIRDRVAGKVYRELGTHQGATAACALLAGAKSVTMVDITHNLIRPNYHLFEAYAKERGVEIELIEKNSHDKSTVGPCDVLLIDSKHTADHLRGELRIHADDVREHIILHDTHTNRGLAMVANNLDGWKVEIDERINVGYMVLTR